MKIITFWMLFVTMVSTLSAQRTEYYRHLIFRETPFSDTRGNHPINADMAKMETHYRFVYDRKDRLVEVSHRLGNNLINDNGNWDSFIWFSSKMTIEYRDNQEIRYYYNNLNDRVEVHGNVYKAVFDLNKNGTRISAKFYNKENEPSENAWGIHSYQWTPLGDGNVIEENFSRWMVFDKNFSPVEGNAPEFAIGEHLYDARGNKVELRGYDIKGNNKAMPNGVARVLNSYDKFNNLVEIRALDIEANVTSHVKQEFSLDGMRVEWIKFLDTNEKLTMNPSGQFAAIKFEYNKDGSESGRKFYDQNLKEIKV